MIQNKPRFLKTSKLKMRVSAAFSYDKLLVVFPLCSCEFYITREVPSSGNRNLLRNKVKAAQRVICLPLLAVRVITQTLLTCFGHQTVEPS